MNTIEMNYYTDNASIMVNIKEPKEINSNSCNKAIAIVNNSSFAGFVIGGAIGSLIGIPITFAKGFNTGYSEISQSSAIAIALTTYFTGCILGAYYKPLFSACKHIITKSYTTCIEKKQ